MPRPTDQTATSRRARLRARPALAATLALGLLAAGPLAGAGPVSAAAPNGGAACAVPKAGAPARATEAGETKVQTSDGGVIEIGGAPTSVLPTVTPTRPATGAATPLAKPAATLPAAPSPGAGNAPDARNLGGELTATAQALGACLSAANAETVADLATGAYLGQLFYPGQTLSRDAFLASADQLLPVRTDVRKVENAKMDGPDKATAEVTQVVGNQLLRSRMGFVRPKASAGGAAWQVDREEPLAVAAPAGSQTLAVTLNDGAISLDQAQAKGPSIVLKGTNQSQQDHEMLVLNLDGKSVTDLLRTAGPALPDFATYVGQATVPAGGTASVTLVDLAPGTYTILCLFPDQQGQPHAALGESATFTVGGS